MGMTNKERAKQFLPFDAMKGLTEELRIREEHHTRVPRAELSETQTQEVNRVLTELTPGDRAEITYYQGGHYHTEQLTFVKNDLYRRILVTEQTEIPFVDIFSVEKNGI